MDDIHRAQVDVDGPAGGNHELVAGDELADILDLLVGILEAEPPLLAHGVDLVGVGLLRLGDIVRVPDALEGGDGDDDEREDGRADQAELDQRVTMALFRRHGIFLLGRAGAEFKRRVRKDGTDDQENDESHPAGDIEQVALRHGDRAVDHDGGLVSVHPPEIEIAAREKDDAAEGEGRAAPAGGSREQGVQTHGVQSWKKKNSRKNANRKRVREPPGISSHIPRLNFRCRGMKARRAELLFAVGSGIRLAAFVRLTVASASRAPDT